MIKKILIGLVALVAVFLIVAAFQPDDYRVSRSASITAEPSVVFARVNDLKKWDAWSPWEKLDPAMKKTYEGPAAGTGASYTWAGNSKVGEGRCTITESRPNEIIRTRLDFKKPFESTCTADFTFKQTGRQTEITWTMQGKNNFIGKAMCLVMNMDKMVGGQFEEGLASLKKISESSPQKG
ncbi:MAG TPA: SRPBCC family protein [Opitutaceae bacterium]|nr:SRPBCC family protein [Opitutaceae bacterium]